MSFSSSLWPFPVSLTIVLIILYGVIYAYLYFRQDCIEPSYKQYRLPLIISLITSFSIMFLCILYRQKLHFSRMLGLVVGIFVLTFVALYAYVAIGGPYLCPKSDLKLIAIETSIFWGITCGAVFILFMLTRKLGVPKISLEMIKNAQQMVKMNNPNAVVEDVGPNYQSYILPSRLTSPTTLPLRNQ